MKNIFIVILFTVLIQPVFAQVYNSGFFYNSGTLLITDYKINSGTFTNTGLSYIGGNITNNGNTNYDGGTLILNGSSSQLLSGTNTFSSTSVIINNNAGITLSKCLSINTTATFSNGLVSTSSGSVEPIEFTSTATTTMVSDASHVNGHVRKLGTGIFTYPVGDATRYQKTDINSTINTTGIVVRYLPNDAGTFPFGTTGTDPEALLYYNQFEYWEINPISSVTGSVTIYWDNYRNMGIGSINDLRVAHQISNQWLNEGTTGTGTIASGNVTSNSLSNLSTVTLGSRSASSTLPVTLTNFVADLIDCEKVNINWHVASEINFSHYDLQYSKDAQAFTSLTTILPSGDNSNYNFLFTNPIEETLYFRLKIIDKNNTFSYSPIISKNIGCQEKVITVFPTITNDLLTIKSNKNNVLNYSLYDAKGSLVIKNEFINQTKIQMISCEEGIYNLVIYLSDGSIQNFKIIKLKQ